MKVSYQICIGSYFDVSKSRNVPKQTIAITQEQFEIIGLLADIKKDSELNTIYKINECEFTIRPMLNSEYIRVQDSPCFTPKESTERFTQ